MPTVAIIQARMGSSRLPGKVLRKLCGQPMLWHIVQRTRQVRGIGEVVVATSDQPTDLPIRSFCDEAGISCFAGSEVDVLDRFYQAAKKHSANPVVRLTGDCPFVDPQIVSKLLVLFSGGQYDHVGVATGAGAAFLEEGRYPDGLDCECFSFAALEGAWKEATQTSDREHVTAYIWRNPDQFRLGTLKTDGDYGHCRWVVDNAADFELVRRVYKALYPADHFFLMQDILEFLNQHPEIMELNKSHLGLEGYQQVWFPGRSTDNLEARK